MITLEDFWKLKSGDVLIWHRNPNNPYFRTVIDGPADDGRKGVTFPIRQRSWTGRSHTVYFWNEIRDICTKSSIRRDMLMSDEELDRILKAGLHPKWDLEWNLEDSARLVKLGMKRCSLNLMKRAKRTLDAFRFAEIK